MEVERFGTEKPPAMTYDELSMERSKSFVKALQELKNLRPQLYSAAEYCEKSYLRSEQKQMILDNLKDYAVRALVNAVDHLGTVAFKLTDVLDQHTMDISSMELKITCINQQLLTCQTYTDKEGLRQQQLLFMFTSHAVLMVLPTYSSLISEIQLKIQNLSHSIPAYRYIVPITLGHLPTSPKQGSSSSTSSLIWSNLVQLLSNTIITYLKGLTYDQMT